MATKQRKATQKKSRRKVQRGVVHILATCCRAGRIAGPQDSRQVPCRASQKKQ